MCADAVNRTSNRLQRHATHRAFGRRTSEHERRRLAPGEEALIHLHQQRFPVQLLVITASTFQPHVFGRVSRGAWLGNRFKRYREAFKVGQRLDFKANNYLLLASPGLHER